MRNLFVHRGFGLLAVMVLAGSGLVGAVHAAPPSKVAAPALPGSAAEPGFVPLVDPMETVRERLKSKLGPSGSADAVPPEVSEDPESLAMERLRARLAKRLGVEANVTKPNELRLTTRIATPAEVEAARVLANTPRQGRNTGGMVGVGGAIAAPRAAVTAPHAAADAGPPQLGQPWAYEGPNGPPAWARLKPEYAVCGSGKRQSPIDIRDGIRLNLDPLVFEYSASSLKVVDDGRSLQAQVGPGNAVSLRGRRYELQHVQFHTPAEDHVQGKVYDMSASLVHKDAQGRWLVLSVLLDRGPAQPVLQTVLDNLPLEKGDDVSALQPLDWRGLLPEDLRYAIYMGSLTSPPCTEGVVRIVMKTPLTVSPEQLAIFSRLYPMNARPVQSSAGRVVKESN